MVDAGVNRVSLGVQSFDDEVLATLGRSHDGAQAEEALSLAAGSGVSVGVDLICGVPGQTPASWADTLERAAVPGVGHVSVYPLSVEENTPLADAVDAGELTALDEDVVAEMMLEAEAVLTRRGLSRYEVANYAVPAQESRHNGAYWAGRPYIGLGPGAHSMGGRREALLAGARAEEAAPGDRVRFETVRDVDAYLAEPTGSVGDMEVLGRRESMVEDVMLGMRLADGVHARSVAAVDMEVLFAEMRAEGLLTLGGKRWRTSRKGWLLGNEVFGRIWSAR
jgi:oxygen-independent coproporphyrinogen-3 oxidase